MVTSFRGEGREGLRWLLGTGTSAGGTTVTETRRGVDALLHGHSSFSVSSRPKLSAGLLCDLHVLSA